MKLFPPCSCGRDCRPVKTGGEHTLHRDVSSCRDGRAVQGGGFRCRSSSEGASSNLAFDNAKRGRLILFATHLNNAPAVSTVVGQPRSVSTSNVKIAPIWPPDSSEQIQKEPFGRCFRPGTVYDVPIFTGTVSGTVQGRQNRSGTVSDTAQPSHFSTFWASGTWAPFIKITVHRFLRHPLGTLKAPLRHQPPPGTWHCFRAGHSPVTHRFRRERDVYYSSGGFILRWSKAEKDREESRKATRNITR